MTDDRPVRSVGILGGGQLARMGALAGIPLGLRFEILDPSGDACAAILGHLHRAPFDDAAAAAELARSVDVVTFDFENVPADAARAASAQAPFRPPVGALEACQDRITEKTLLRDLDIAVPDFLAVDGRTDLMEAVERLGFPCVLKTRRLGYDGKGQAVLRGPEDLERAWQRIGGSPLIAEAFVPFEAECSLLAVQDDRGERRAWPLTGNLHDRGMLVLSRPGVLPDALQREAEDIVGRLLRHFGYVGVIAVEFFVREGKLLVNEIAPRVHNSGHWTIDAATTSQFENHLRAVCGLPLGETAQESRAVMFNWIGELPDAAELLAVPGLHWHDYGKAARAGRKVGHATITAPDDAVLRLRCERAIGLLGGEWPARWRRFGAMCESASGRDAPGQGASA